MRFCCQSLAWQGRGQFRVHEVGGGRRRWASSGLFACLSAYLYVLTCVTSDLCVLQVSPWTISSIRSCGLLQRTWSHHWLWQLRGLLGASGGHVWWVVAALSHRCFHLHPPLHPVHFLSAEAFSALEKDGLGTIELNLMEVPSSLLTTQPSSLSAEAGSTYWWL